MTSTGVNFHQDVDLTLPRATRQGEALETKSCENKIASKTFVSSLSLYTSMFKSCLATRKTIRSMFTICL